LEHGLLLLLCADYLLCYDSVVLLGLFNATVVVLKLHKAPEDHSRVLKSAELQTVLRPATTFAMFNTIDAYSFMNTGSQDGSIPILLSLSELTLPLTTETTKTNPNPNNQNKTTCAASSNSTQLLLHLQRPRLP
jgi:hypothetical protein